MACTRPILALILCTCGLPALAQSDTPEAPPVARRVDAVDTAFGLSIPDPYRWMEGENNAEHDAWLKAQGEATRQRLDALPTLAAWRERLTATAGSITISMPSDTADNPILLRRSVSGAPAVLLARENDGSERVLFDPAAEKGAVSRVMRSPDGKLVALNVFRQGDEAGRLDVREIATGRLVERLKPVWSEFEVSWLPDSSGFFYTRMRDFKPGDADPVQGMAAWLHRVGQPITQDRLIARAGGGGRLDIPAKDFPLVSVQPGSRWATLSSTGARATRRMCFAPLEDVLAERADWRCLIRDEDGIHRGGALVGDTYYLLQAGAFPNLRLIALDLARPDAGLDAARVVIPESADTVLTDVSASRGALHVGQMRDGIESIARLDPASGTLTPVALPFAGTAWVMANPAHATRYVVATGWTRPQQVFRLSDDGTLQPTGFGEEGAPDYSMLVVDRVEATSADGTRVPMTIIHRNDMRTDGRNLAIVRGYGGYGILMWPLFAPSTLEWVKQGHVAAVCHTRGGGEKGDAWRTGGSGIHKQRGVEDFIACGRELQTRGISTQPRIFGSGRSMGGILTGGAYTTPGQDGFGGMVIGVGTLNASRVGAMKNGANQFAEMGDPNTEAGMTQLLAMDPYQRLRPGTRYIPLLLTVGLVDQRVAPWNSSKFAAQVMHLSPSTPVWIRTDGGLGHFATSALEGVAETADTYAAIEALAGSQP